MKKTAKTKKQTSHLTLRQQWGLILLLVVVLIGFAFLVAGLDMIWNAQKSA